jgi:DNA-binding transcriptional regulator PaaX
MAHPDTRPISFTYPPVASTCVVTLHRLFLYSDPPLPSHPPSDWLGLFSSRTFSRINTPIFLKLSHFSYLPAYKDETECFETSAYKILKLGNYPEESTKLDGGFVEN